jgi:hypothetical protein
MPGDDVISDAELSALRQNAAQPPAPEPELDLKELRTQLEAEDDAVLGKLFELKDNEPQREAAIIKLARETGSKYDAIAPHFDEISRAWEASKRDTRRFRKEQPRLAELMLRNPLVGKVAMQDEKVSGLTKFLRAYDKVDAYADTLATQGPGLAGASPEEIRADTFAAAKDVEAGRAELPKPPTQEELFPAPRRMPMVTDPSANKGAFAKLAASASFTRKQNEYADLWAQIGRREQLGLPTLELERQAVDMEPDLIPRYFGETTGLQQTAVDVGTIAPSVLDSLIAGGFGGVAGAVAGAVPGIVTRNPELIRKGVMMGGSIGAKSASFGQSFNREFGMTYGQLQKEKTDDGRPVDRDVARGAAILYGGAAAMVELATFGASASAWGPLGDAVAKGTGKAFIKGLIKDVGVRALLKDLGKRWIRGGAAEMTEEVAQESLGILASYLARSTTAGKAQEVDLGAIRDQLAETAVTTLRGSMGLAPALVTTNVTAQLTSARLQRQASERGAKKAAAILGAIPGSPTGVADPKAMADLIAAETAASGEPVKHISLVTSRRTGPTPTRAR